MLRPLTALRFFAALMVFAHHDPLTIAARSYHTGDAGVEFFFILSGFILTYVHRELFEAKFDFVNVRNFWAARFARIYPVHVLAFAFGMYLVIRSGGAQWFAADLRTNAIALFAQLTLTMSWIQVYSPININSVAWSISDEAFFYAVFPFACVACFALFRRTGSAGAAVSALSFWMVALALAVRTGGAGFVYAFPPARLLDFAIGICLGVMFTNADRAGRHEMSRARATALEIAALAAAIVAVAVTPEVFAPLRYSVWVAPFSALVIYAFALGRGVVSQMLSAAVLVYLGEISYNFYMLHALIVAVIFQYAGPVGLVPVSLLALVICVAVSTVVFERFEHPLRERIRRHLSAPRIEPAAAA